MSFLGWFTLVFRRSPQFPEFPAFPAIPAIPAIPAFPAFPAFPGFLGFLVVFRVSHRFTGFSSFPVLPFFGSVHSTFTSEWELGGRLTNVGRSCDIVRVQRLHTVLRTTRCLLVSLTTLHAVRRLVCSQPWSYRAVRFVYLTIDVLARRCFGVVGSFLLCLLFIARYDHNRA